MTGSYPHGWNHHSEFATRLRDLVIRADCEWLQAVSDLSFMLGVMLQACDDKEMRMATWEAIAKQLLDTAHSGMLPGETLQ